MRTVRSRRATLVVGALPILLCLAAGPSAPQQGATLTVTKKVTKLREQKRMLSTAVAELKEGDRLVQNEKSGAWIRATRDRVTGWIHQSDVTERQDVRMSGEGVRENYSASDTAAARKGFNPEVEKRYRETSPGLAAAFAIVDRIQGRKPSEASVATFVRDGKLHEEAR